MLGRREAFVGTTRECFDHLLAENTDIRLVELIAKFCRVTVNTVIQWRAGNNIAGGESTLRLRVLLDIAGYKVQELHAIDQQARNFAFLIGIGDILSPVQASALLGYRPTLQSLWRILVPTSTQTAESGYSEQVGKNMEELYRTHRAQVTAASAELRKQLEVFTGSKPPTETSRTDQAHIDNAVLATTFARSASVLASLAVLLQTPAQQKAVLEATRDGYDIQALITQLQPFLPSK